ncbi:MULTISPECIES: [FeFe] hydrogenase H-cluster maturation GTPase HydF [unclassified Candidatus Frackibacter]|uniref:[FeFe] hydrogenase H-cluster maturation GTPase HydF n=1 Tax=unclassified Candidatus Frackibacter TaxID=2648818 RepID=UPI00088BDDE9|nr:MULTISPECIES: [FeFe] hydrogenase H-cluster maturation GTPase HydF [unclassified Candidatus Frackibacter]SDC44000.1 [FeFe] hydrogenase H-cluster maturation GTPase HydF [Candidatus Frackibacter sp. WG11]SEM64297.1 [FeFe] hydrogenase H-cluster maturation GTPase HydF [Candidatus Frackibacter sp. WG12]SFL68404.1 [FeFe] hydrogenase H-cluster maturation GTPase HydF [Candidatus Frackibacter sp. WG13]
MEETPQANRLHIAIFGRRNAGKSSLINALTNQDLAVVSEVAGTTTDPVYKRMELLPIGPVVMIDTAGIDDVGELGSLRVKKTKEVLSRTDLAILVIDPEVGIDNYEKELLAEIKEREIPVIGVVNKEDKVKEINIRELAKELKIKLLQVSAITREGIEGLKKEIALKAPEKFEKPHIIGDMINPQDIVILVVPIDLAAPKGRLILPQVQTLRDILDNDGQAVVVKEGELKGALDSLNKEPKLVVTDSQVFKEVTADVPENIMLTGFSILFARYKGDLEILTKGVKGLDDLEIGNRVLIAESCTHHRTADDIGKVKIPRWLRQMVGGELEFEHVSGREFPDDLDNYDLIVQCGGCMTNRKEILYRLNKADSLGIPIINYGMLIAHVHGILDRALEPFPLAKRIWKQ